MPFAAPCYRITKVSPATGASVKAATVKVPDPLSVVMTVACPRKCAVVVASSKIITRPWNCPATVFVGVTEDATTDVVVLAEPTVP